MLGKKKAIEIARQYAEEVKKIISPVSIVVFGSYINGKPHEFSDIDVAVIVKNFEGDFLETAQRLHSLTWDISVDIEPHLVDEAYDKSGFVQHIKNTGEYIYKNW